MKPKSALTARQQMFIKEYLVDLNATQAAIRAGYSSRTANEQGARLLANVSVKAAIEEGMNKRADQLGLDAYWVLKRLKDISDRCMQAKPLMEFDRVEREMVHVVDEETGEYLYIFESGGATRAAELIGKHIGMFKERVDLTTGDKPLKAYLALDPDEV